MESVIEHQRNYHEERERLTDAMVRERIREKKTHKESVNSDHRMKALLDRYVDSTKHLAQAYTDKDGSRRNEIETISGPNEFAEFYSRLKALKDLHRNFPQEAQIPLSLEFSEIQETLDDPARTEPDMIEFTDEEGYGRYLDLHEAYTKFINLKGVEKVDYLTYLSTFDKLFEVSKERKNSDYKKYLDYLAQYLSETLLKMKPLMDLGEELSKARDSFNKQWSEGMFPGWTLEDSMLTTLANANSSSTSLSGGGAMSRSGAFLDLSPFNTPEELKALGMDRIKSALMALNLKCGGTLEERSQRLFNTKGRRMDELDKNLFSKSTSTSSSSAVINADHSDNKEKAMLQKRKELASLEAQVYHLVELLSEQRAATRENVERKQARGPGEEDEEEEVAAPVSDDDDEDEVPYNPKNLPLDWDGKPIPYWLYKLHGLNISYPCEICGNQIYKGPKAFQRHFSEWRHAHGMRCLGIPNTAHFANITKIAEALELWARLREQKEQERFKPELDEEYEDTHGNVVNKKTFEDLLRQGLL